MKHSLFSSLVALSLSSPAIAAPEASSPEMTETDWNGPPREIDEYARTYFLEGRCLFSDPSATAKEWSQPDLYARQFGETVFGQQKSPIGLVNCSKEVNAAHAKAFRGHWAKVPVAVLLIPTVSGSIAWLTRAKYQFTGDFEREIVEANCRKDGWSCGKGAETPFRVGADPYSLRSAKDTNESVHGYGLVALLTNAREAQGRHRPEEWATTLSWTPPSPADIAAEPRQTQKPEVDASVVLSKEARRAATASMRRDLESSAKALEALLREDHEQLAGCVQHDFEAKPNHRDTFEFSAQFDSTARTPLSTTLQRRESRTNRCLQTKTIELLQAADSKELLGTIHGRYPFEVTLSVRPDVWHFTLLERLEQERESLKTHKERLSILVKAVRDNRMRLTTYRKYLAPVVLDDLAIFLRPDLEEKLSALEAAEQRYVDAEAAEKQRLQAEECTGFAQWGIEDATADAPEFVRSRPVWREKAVQIKINDLIAAMRSFAQPEHVEACEEGLKALYDLIEIAKAADSRALKAHERESARKRAADQKKRASQPSRSRSSTQSWRDRARSDFFKPACIAANGAKVCCEGDLERFKYYLALTDDMYSAASEARCKTY